MVETIVKFNNKRALFEFAILANKCSDDVFLYTGKEIVNIKSPMNAGCIDITQPLKVEFYGDIPYEVKEGMKKFIVN